MPELPEVETVRLFLDKNILGKTITHLEILNPKSFIARPEHVEGLVANASPWLRQAQPERF